MIIIIIINNIKLLIIIIIIFIYIFLTFDTIIACYNSNINNNGNSYSSNIESPLEPGLNFCRPNLIWVDTPLFVGKPVNMSSQLPCTGKFCFPGSRAVDGIYVPAVDEDILTSLAHTLREDNPYIQIDLQGNHCIFAVKVWTLRSSISKFFRS